MTTRKKATPQRTTNRISLGPFVSPTARLAVREKNGEQSLALALEAREGAPIHPNAELGRVEDPNCSTGAWQDVTTLYSPEDRPAGSGPAQVATDAYREGYDRIFGKKPTVGLA